MAAVHYSAAPALLAPAVLEARSATAVALWQTSDCWWRWVGLAVRKRAFAAFLDRAVLVAVLVAEAVGLMAAGLLAVGQRRPALLDRLPATAVLLAVSSVCLILLLSALIVPIQGWQASGLTGCLTARPPLLLVLVAVTRECLPATAGPCCVGSGPCWTVLCR